MLPPIFTVRRRALGRLQNRPSALLGSAACARNCLRVAFILGATLAPSVTLAQPTLYAIGSGVGDISSNLYTVSNYGTSPVAVPIAETGLLIYDIAISPISGEVYCIGNNFYTLCRIDRTTGALTPVGPPTFRIMNALDFAPDGTLYGWGGPGTDSSLYTISTDTGLASRIGAVGFDSGGDLAIDCDGTLYGATSTQLIRINRATGAGTLVGPFGFSGAYGLAIDPVTNDLLVGRGTITGSPAFLYRASRTTGATTLIGTIAGASTFGMSGLAFDTQLVGVGFASSPSPGAQCPTGLATYSVTPTGTPPFSYEWQIEDPLDLGSWITLGKDPLALPSSGGGTAFASPINSPSVSIGVRGRLDVFHVRCIVTNGCGSVVTSPVTLTIIDCPADQNCDGFINSADFFEFLGAFFSSSIAADFNDDGEVNTQDFFDYVAAFFAGC